MGVSYARLCFPYAAAVALSKDGVDIPDFRPERFAAAGLKELASRIEVIVDANPDPNALVPQTVQVALKSGAVHETVVRHALGSPAKPLDRTHHVEKFRRCWARGHGTPAAVGDVAALPRAAAARFPRLHTLAAPS